jgi:glycerol-3-phosphate dehydrogenase subunit C
MPYLDGGAVKEAKGLIADNVKSLAEAVRQGREIVVPGPTCSYMLKQEYPWLDGWSPPIPRSLRVPGLRAGPLDRAERPRPIAYQPCHLKAQNAGTARRRCVSPGRQWR